MPAPSLLSALHALRTVQTASLQVPAWIALITTSCFRDHAPHPVQAPTTESMEPAHLVHPSVANALIQILAQHVPLPIAYMKQAASINAQLATSALPMSAFHALIIAITVTHQLHVSHAAVDTTYSMVLAPPLAHQATMLPMVTAKLAQQIVLLALMEAHASLALLLPTSMELHVFQHVQAVTTLPAAYASNAQQTAFHVRLVRNVLRAQVDMTSSMDIVFHLAQLDTLATQTMIAALAPHFAMSAKMKVLAPPAPKASTSISPNVMPPALMEHLHSVAAATAAPILVIPVSLQIHAALAQQAITYGKDNVESVPQVLTHSPMEIATYVVQIVMFALMAKLVHNVLMNMICSMEAA